MIWVGFIEEGWKYHQRIDSNKGLAVGLNRVGRTGLSKSGSGIVRFGFKGSNEFSFV